MAYTPKAPMPGKGEKGLLCNVTHCQREDSAHHYNSVMRKWYCVQCATRIEEAARRDGMSFYSDLPDVVTKRLQPVQAKGLLDESDNGGNYRPSTRIVL